jgi:hypothetical protein
MIPNRVLAPDIRFKPEDHGAPFVLPSKARNGNGSNSLIICVPIPTDQLL